MGLFDHRIAEPMHPPTPRTDDLASYFTTPSDRELAMVNAMRMAATNAERIALAKVAVNLLEPGTRACLVRDLDRQLWQEQAP